MTHEDIPESIARLRTICRVTPRTPDEWINSLRRGDASASEECARIARVGAERSSHRRRMQGWESFSAEEIEDIVAECCLRLIERVADTRFVIKERFFEAYILTVVTNYTIDIIREKANQPLEPLDDSRRREAGQIGQSGVSPEREGLYQALEYCLGQLNARYRQIAEWYSYGMPRAWIAAHLDPPTTPNTVGVRWDEIRRKLRGCLERGGYAVQL